MGVSKVVRSARSCKQVYEVRSSDLHELRSKAVHPLLKVGLGGCQIAARIVSGNSTSFL